MTAVYAHGPIRSAYRRTGGPAYRVIDTALSSWAPYRAFREGQLDREAYTAQVEQAPGPPARHLTEDQRNLSTRFPVDERAYVARALERLRAAGVVDAVDYPERDFDALAALVAERCDHAGRTTYIFPEEARLLFALAHVVAPRQAVFLGSYYGYWALWAMPGIVASGGRAVLVDLDPQVLQLARHNFTALGVEGWAEFRAADATRRGPDPGDGEIDLCVLDAEGPSDCPDESRRDKAIYHPIMEAWTPALRPGGLVVAHNMLLDNLSANRYFASRIRHNERQYMRFQDHLARHYGARAVLGTTEGVGVYRRGPRPAPAAGR